MRRALFLTLAIAMATLGGAQPARGQTHYWLSTTPAYAMGGLGVSAALGQLNGGNPWLPHGELWIPAGFVGGLIIGRSVDHRRSRGEPISGFQRTALRGASILHGGTVGALAATLIIAPSGPTSFAGDGVIAGVAIGTGMAAGALLQRRRERGWVNGSPVSVQPSLQRDGGAGLTATWSF